MPCKITQDENLYEHGDPTNLHICIFDVISRLQFYSIIKRHGQFLSHNKIKMAEWNRDIAYCREYIGRGRVRALLEAIEDVGRRKEEGQESSSHPSSEVGQGSQI